MENQRFSVLKQKNKPGLTALCIVLCVVLLPLLGLTLTLPQILVNLPIVLLVLLGFVGPVSALVCGVLLCALSCFLFGAWGAVAMCVFLIPALVVSAVMLERGRSFWECVAGSGVAAFVSMGAAVGVLSFVIGSDVVSALSAMVRPAFESMTGLGDSMLVMMVQMGYLAQPEGYEAAIAAGALTESVRGELLSSLELLMDVTLRLELPKQMTTGAIAVGLLGHSALRKGLRSRGNAVECQPLRTWRVPSGWGRVLGITFAAFFLLSQVLPDMFATAFYVFSGVFKQVFTLQGVAAICYVLHKHGKGSKLQALVFVIGYFLASDFAQIAGIIDQCVDFTHRREEFEKEGKDPGPL